MAISLAPATGMRTTAATRAKPTVIHCEKMVERYLVLKGIAGFGDRLMTLARALQLAAATHRTLVIDWSHDSWNHCAESPQGFWHYFDLSGLPANVSVLRGDAETYALLDRLTAENTETVPPIFRGSLRRKDWGLRNGRLFIDDSSVQLTESAIVAGSAPVVVYLAYCSGALEAVLPFLRFRTVDPHAAVRYTIGVHFRNTDKANDLVPVLQRVRSVWKPGRTIYLATDDVAAIDTFQAEFGGDVHYTRPPPRPANGGGIHHASAAELEAVGLTKEDLTHAMIRDIMRLRDSVIFLDCPNSLFSRIVTVLRAFRSKERTL